MELDGALSALDRRGNAGGEMAMRTSAALPKGSGDIEYSPEVEGQIHSLVYGKDAALSGAIEALEGKQSSPPPSKVSTPSSQAPKPNPDEGEMTPSEMLLKAAQMPPGPAGVIGTVTALRRPLAEAGKSVVSGMGANILGGLAGIYTLATNGMDTEKAADTVRSYQEGLTYEPKGTGAKAIVETLGSNANPLNWIPNAANYLAGKGVEKGIISPGEATALSTGATLIQPGIALKAVGKGATALKDIGRAEGETTPFASVGAAAANKGNALKAELQQASPELRKATEKIPVNQLNPIAVKRQVEADALPIPIRLTEGQASGDVSLLSREVNSRASKEALAKRYQEQNAQLKDNLNAIREEVAPNVYGTNHVENGQALIDAYKATDAQITKDITAKYQALRDANGGKFPIDGVAFADAAEAALAKELKTDFLPSGIAKQLDKFKAGEPMNFEQFEAMRTNLAAEMRKAARSGDGNAEFAASIVRDALESLPLSKDAAALKPVADAARAAAKARFDLLRKDPAYKAAVNDSVAPDDFIQKFVVNGKAGDVKQMVSHLGVGSDAHQTMSAGIINYLKAKAGIVNDNGNFSQAQYNKALEQLRPKLVDVVGGKTAKQLESVGNVARWTQEQPRGSFVNNSNTFVAAAGEHVKSLAEGLANKTIGLGVVPVGTMIRNAAAKRAAEQEAMRSLQTGAGIDLRDIGKK